VKSPKCCGSVFIEKPYLTVNTGHNRHNIVCIAGTEPHRTRTPSVFCLHDYHSVSTRSKSPHTVVQGTVQFSYVMGTSVSVRGHGILRDHDTSTGTGTRSSVRSCDGLSKKARTTHTLWGTTRVSCVSGELVRRAVAECGRCGPRGTSVKQI